MAPESVRPLPSGQAAGLAACPPPARRRPTSHPAARSQESAATRPEEGQRNDLLCAGLARGLQNPAYAQRSVSLNCRPDVREPGAATLSPGTPPSGMKAPTRHRGLRPTRANMSRRPGNRSQHPLCDGGAGESSQAEDPRPKNPGLAGTSRAVPVPGRTRRRSPPSVGEERGRGTLSARPMGRAVKRHPLSEIVRFVLDGGRSSQIRFWSDWDSHSFCCGTKGLKHKAEEGASHFRARGRGRTPGQEKRRGRGKAAFKVWGW